MKIKKNNLIKDPKIKNNNIKEWRPNTKQRNKKEITFIFSRVKLKQNQTFHKRNQNINPESKENGSKLKLWKNNRKNKISIKCEIENKLFKVSKRN